MLPRRCLRAIWGICALGPMLAAGANPTAELRVSSETVPPGGTAQIKIFLTAPLAISDVKLEMDFDPAVFGEVDVRWGVKAIGRCLERSGSK